MSDSPARLRFDGHYASGPVTWEEWHAGVRMQGTRYHYTRYYQNGDWVGCYRDHDFDFWAFTESMTPELLADAKQDRAPRIGDYDPLCTAGVYHISGDTVSRTLTPHGFGGMAFTFKCRISGDRVLVPIEDGSEQAWPFHAMPGAV